MRHHLAICKLQASKASQPPHWSLVNPFSTFRFFLSLSIGFFRFALGFSNRNLTEIYTELELKNSATYSLEGHAHACDWVNSRLFKLSNYGIDQYILGWIQDFLNNGLQCVILAGEKSPS